MKGKCSCSGTSLFIARLIIGVLFVMHGYGKLSDISATQTMFDNMGIFLPKIIGPLVGVLELLGGIALILGAYTATAALILGIIMLGALLFVHLKNGIMGPGGSEMVLVFIAALLPLISNGGGKWALRDCGCICGKGEKKGECCGGNCKSK
ncbi:DoxX family protein [Candidatus Nomurabacteria bacterium]|nr:DoxX family protein [Candidatus Nomurabacteria bacterium]